MNNSSSVILKTNANDQEVDQTLLKEIQSVGFFKLFRFADKLDIFLMIIGTLMAIVCGAAQPAFALLWGQMTNSFSSSTVDPDGMVNQAQQIMYNFFELGCGIFVASWLMLACWVITGERQAIKCRKLYLTKLLQQQIGWFDRTNQTELASKFATETFSFQGAIGEKIPTFVMSISMVISGLVIALIKGWKLALVILSYLPALTIAGVFYVNVLQNREKKIRQHYTAAGGKAQQTITAIKTVKSLNGQQYQQKKFNQNLQLASKKTIKFSIMAGVGMGGLIFTMFAAYALSFWYGSHLISENPSNYNVGTVLTIFFSIIMGGMNLSSISPCLKKFAQGQQAAARIYALIDRIPLMIRKQNGKKLDNLIGIIKFENVSFAYPKDPNKWILKNLNIQLKPNKTNALVGQSGCGKSTIMQLLMRFYDPQQGQITLDGIDLKQFDLGWLRQRIGYVGQQPVLFATTIKQNLLFGKSDSTDQQIDNALKKAEAYDFIYKDLPDRLQTYVGYGGGQLSGGQKQRIAIARAILKNPKILLLDEATSALDRKNQKLIQQTLDKITTGRTTITIAHRVKTIMNAEQIFVFNQGKIVQHGKFKELNRFKGLSIDLDQKLSQIALQELQIDNDGKIKQDIIKPTENIQKQNKKQEFNNEKYDDIFKRLFNYNLPDLPLFILGVFVALGHGTLSPIFSLFLAQMMEALIKIQLGQNQEVANFQSLIFLILAIAGFIAVTLQHSIFLVIGEKITKRLRLDTFKKIIRMPISWFDIPKNNSGSLSARLGTDCQLVNGLTSTLISTNIQVFSTLVTGLVIAFIHEWRISLITIALLPVMIGSGIMKMKFTMGFSSQTDEAYKDSSNLIMQAMSNIRTVTSFGVENTINKKYVQKLNQPMNLAMKKGNLSGFLFALSKLFMFFIFALIFYIGTLFVRDFKLAFVDVFTAIFAIMFSAITVGNNSQSMPDVGQSKNSAANIFQILDGEDEDQLQLKQNSKLLVLKQSKGQIQIKNITFKYPTRIKSVFQNFSMKIQAGHKVAFVGSSGCGKSTIIQMLMRFYQPSQGAIYLDGINIKDYDIHYLRSIFGLVSQEPVLFYATYKQNIKYNTEANYEQIVQATKKANALSFIEGDEEKQNNKTEQQQSKGFNKNVGVRGGHISGGQKQRVAIARTVLRNPKILLLDEATSALDSKNEKIVQQSLDNIMDGLTTISVAHRIQTIKNSNKIYVFDSGKIIQQGTYQYLKNKKGYFYRLQKGSSN